MGTGCTHVGAVGIAPILHGCRLAARTAQLRQPVSRPSNVGGCWPSAAATTQRTAGRAATAAPPTEPTRFQPAPDAHQCSTRPKGMRGRARGGRWAGAEEESSTPEHSRVPGEEWRQPSPPARPAVRRGEARGRRRRSNEASASKAAECSRRARDTKSRDVHRTQPNRSPLW
jgi:hypothetical protein